jgi:hypothetical protein
MRNAIEYFMENHRLNPGDRALVLEKLEKATASAAGRLELEAELNTGAFEKAGLSRGAHAVLAVAVEGLDSEAKGESGAWEYGDRDEAAEAREQKADALARIDAATEKGDMELAKSLRQSLEDTNAEEEATAAHWAKLDAGVAAREGK